MKADQTAEQEIIIENFNLVKWWLMLSNPIKQIFDWFVFYKVG